MLLIQYILVTLVAATALADNRGTSEIGFCHPKNSYAAVLSQFRRTSEIRIGWLDNTFNAQGCPNAEKLMEEERPLVLRVHILNGPGLRNRRLERHEIHYKQSVESLDRKIRHHSVRILARYRARLAALRSIFDRRGTRPLTLYLSPCLECNLSAEARAVLLAEDAAVFPSALLVDNPMRGNPVRGALWERHGSLTTGDILDLDGEDFDVINARAWARKNADAKLLLAWKPCKNGFASGGPWIPPTKRKNFCTASDLRHLRNWLAQY